MEVDPSSSSPQLKRKDIDADGDYDIVEISTKKSKTIGSTPGSSPKSSARSTPASRKSILNSSKGGKIQLKKGKITFAEKKLDFVFHSSTLPELTEFRAWHALQTETIKVFPDQHLGLLAKLVQESDSTLNDLVKSIKKSLIAEDSILQGITDEVISVAVQSIAARVNYGVQLDNPPKPMSIWRWEVGNLELLPSDSLEKVVLRRSVREQARDELIETIKDYSEEEMNALLPKKAAKSAKSTAKAKEKELKQIKKEKEKEVKLKEKEAKQKEKEERQRIKEEKQEEKRLEKKKKEEEKQAKENEKKMKEKKASKSQQRILGFFPVLKKENDISEEKIPDKIAVYKEAFPPFHLKSNVELACINRFAHKIDPDFESNLFSDTYKVSLEDCLEVLKKVSLPVEKVSTKKKLLLFHEDYRPAFYGYWAKVSKKINGKTPLIKDDDVLDYEYDSEAEWEEEEPGEDLVSDDDEVDSVQPDENEDEEDGWLVPHGYLSDEERGVDDCDETKAVAKVEPKRRILEKLVSIVLGPCLANISSTDPFVESLIPVGYDIKVLDGSSTSIDPWDSKSFAEEIPTTEASPFIQNDTKKSNSTRKSLFPDDQIEILKKVVSNGANKGMQKLVDELKECLPNVSKSKIESKIKEIAVKEKRSGETRASWHLKE